MTTIPDPRALLRQAQLQTQANRYASLRKAADKRVINEVKR